ncbi:helix-turn-helix transcriptional regulator [Ancylobacter sp. TS-1]|uniref:ArsR/SmtB family transcription factor n=1 Tax=Ancylobacter sp. TS-1 TaxID=1850374 RepID=UPI001FEDE5A7|nr:metalloregulator ArsR/SmtB family transcription factor [Ancylobacter sp. TS-1]
MDTDNALSAFAALSQPTRLDVFRLLVAHEPEGLPAGEVARRLDVPHNTLSTHLGILARAELIAPERRSRLIIYRAQLETVRHLASFMLKECCGGKPEICAPLITDLQPCCPAGPHSTGTHSPGTHAAKEARHV